MRCTCTRARGRRASLTCSSAIGRTRCFSRSQAGLNRQKTRSSWALTPWPYTSGGRGTTPPSSIGATSSLRDHQRLQFLSLSLISKIFISDLAFISIFFDSQVVSNRVGASRRARREADQWSREVSCNKMLENLSKFDSSFLIKIF